VPAAGQHRADLLDQPGLLRCALAVQAVAVGALQHQGGRAAPRRRRGAHGALRADGDVAADQHRPFGRVQPGHGRPEHVPCGPEAAGPTGQQRRQFAVGQRADAPQQRVDLALAVGRKIPALRRADLADPHRVLQHHRHERGRGRRGQHRGRGKRAGRQRQGADVVGMGVGDDDGVHPAEVLQAGQVGQGIRVVQAHASIDQHALAAGLQEQTTGADGGRAAQEVQVHTSEHSGRRGPRGGRARPGAGVAVRITRRRLLRRADRRRTGPPAERWRLWPPGRWVGLSTLSRSTVGGPVPCS